MWEDRKGFPHFTSAVNDLGGIKRFKYIIGSFNSEKMKIGLTWDGYFDECLPIRSIEKIVSANCSKVLNHKAIRKVTIDYDKLKFRSKEWENMGSHEGRVLNHLGQ